MVKVVSSVISNAKVAYDEAERSLACGVVEVAGSEGFIVFGGEEVSN